MPVAMGLATIVAWDFDGGRAIYWKWFGLFGLGGGGWGEVGFNAEARRFGDRAEILGGLKARAEFAEEAEISLCVLGWARPGGFLKLPGADRRRRTDSRWLQDNDHAKSRSRREVLREPR